MKKYYTTALLSMIAFATLHAQTTGFREIYAGQLTGVLYNSVAWGDYDADGDLDILLTGATGNVSYLTPISKIYENTGVGFTEVYAGQLTGVDVSSVAWGDYDADGDLDILLSGCSSIDRRGICLTKISKIYQNTGTGFTEVYAGQLTGVFAGSVAWGDYDADGDLDILLTGTGETSAFVSRSPISKIYQNTGLGFNEVFAGQLTGVLGGSVAWGDYDADGDLDILLTGNNSSDYRASISISKIYQNTGAGFTEVYTGQLTGVSDGSSATWGDYDADGDLDILLTGRNSSGIISKIYQNTGVGFTEVYAGQLTLTMVGFGYSSSVAWGDYDADGDLDILLTGRETSKIYQNTGAGFTEVYAGQLTRVGDGSVAWGDYDADGDLDILLAGSKTSKIYKNHSATRNTAPTAPTNLSTSIAANGAVNFTWDASTDTQTSQNGLNYDLYVGTATGVYNKTPTKAIISSGKRLNAEFGPLQTNSWTIHDLAGTYYWSVQAIDAGLMGSPLAAEGTFTIINQTNITAFSFAEQNGPTTINTRNHTVTIEVFLSTSLLALTPIIEVSPGASISPASGEVQDFSSPVTYTVTAQDGSTTQDWAVSIITLEFTEVFAGQLTGVNESSVAWGDYDADGDLDILLTGYELLVGTIFSKIYQNTGPTGFTEVFEGQLTTVTISSVAWGDYDADGDLDILLMGTFHITPDGRHFITSKIYQNTGAGFIEVYAGQLTKVHYGSVAWGDYDADGDLDILLTGQNRDRGVSKISKIYQNTGAGFTEVYTGQLTGVSDGSAAWGDYDADGDLDILLTGTGSSRISKIYQNTGAGFTEVFAGQLTGVYQSSIAWGDYDADGDLDILLTGRNSSDIISKIYQNTGLGFTEVYAGQLTGVLNGSVAWGDYDADGDLDILLTGNTSSDYRVLISISKIYQNTGTGFTEVFTRKLAGVTDGSVAWGDYDADGDLDILLTGIDTNTGNNISKIYENHSTTRNTAPTAPTNLSTTVGMNGDVRFTWDASTDSQTPSDGLNYDIYVGTATGVYNTTPTKAIISSGKRLNSEFGTLQTNSWSISGLAHGSYFWSIQAIDAGLMGSPLSAEGTFTHDRTNITAFSFPEQTRTATINTTNHTVAIIVAFGTSLLALTSTIEVSTGGTISPLSGVIQDFTNPVTYTVTAQDGTIQDWAVMVTVNEAPTSVALSDNNIAEGATIGTAVGTLSTVDPDAGDTHTYAISGTDAVSFTIGGTNSNELQNASVFVFATKSSYAITVTATDSGGATVAQDFTITVTPTTGINNPNNRLVHVYPNPSKGQITIVLDVVLQNANWNLYDLSGKVLSTKNKSVNGLETNVDITHLPDGIYLLKIDHKSKQITKQISIVR